MDICDAAPRPIGKIEIQVYRHGVLIESWEADNQIVNGYRAIHAALVGGNVTTNSVTTIGFGTSTTSALPTDTALTGAFVKAVDSATISATQIVYAFSLAPSEAIGVAIGEFGLLTPSGLLYARKVRAVALAPKDSTLSMSGTWTITL